MTTRISFVIALSLLLFASPLAAQQTDEVPAPAPKPTPQATTDKPAWRDNSRYMFMAVAMTVAAAQNMATAINLREYCANEKISNEFVRARLASFSKITGREETCASLMDY
ncbi:MAG: hypothetical protein LBR05_06020 [Azoarcus sp.]|jgi:negative regulator of sigma E activity|nr:hypothetical protein [Azoarcus sp.]